MVAAQQEYEAAVKEKDEKEASAQALLSEQEKEMNSIVEESRKLQKEAEENLKVFPCSLYMLYLCVCNFPDNK